MVFGTGDTPVEHVDYDSAAPIGHLHQTFGLGNSDLTWVRAGPIVARRCVG